MKEYSRINKVYICTKTLVLNRKQLLIFIDVGYTSLHVSVAYFNAFHYMWFNFFFTFLRLNGTCFNLRKRSFRCSSSGFGRTMKVGDGGLGDVIF